MNKNREVMSARAKIIAIDQATGERIEITDLYWFEENGVHDFDGDGIHAKYRFEISVFDIEKVVNYKPDKVSGLYFEKEDIRGTSSDRIVERNNDIWKNRQPTDEGEPENQPGE